MPPEVPGGIVMAVAGLGILVNLGTAALFHRGQSTDLNKRGAYLHLLADAGVSVAAVLAGLGMLTLGWRWLDPALATIVAVIIALTSWGLLRASFRQAMDAVPAHINRDEVQSFLESLPNVRGRAPPAYLADRNRRNRAYRPRGALAGGWPRCLPGPGRRSNWTAASASIMRPCRWNLARAASMTGTITRRTIDPANRPGRRAATPATIIVTLLTHAEPPC